MAGRLPAGPTLRAGRLRAHPGRRKLSGGQPDPGQPDPGAGRRALAARLRRGDPAARTPRGRTGGEAGSFKSGWPAAGTPHTGHNQIRLS